MIVNSQFIKITTDTIIYSDEEFLLFQIWQLVHVYCSEAAAIKNNDLEFVAYTNQYAEEFYLTENDLGQKSMATVNKSVCEVMEKQELEIIITKKPQDNMFHFTSGSTYVNYIMRKRPLINPTTENVVGILIFAIKFDIVYSRRFFLKYLIPSSVPLQQSYDIQLSEQQQQIVTCLLLGFHKRKEITEILNSINDDEYKEFHIKQMLQSLYQQFNCKDIRAILDLITVASEKNDILNVTGVSVPSGNSVLHKE